MFYTRFAQIGADFVRIFHFRGLFKAITELGGVSQID